MRRITLIVAFFIVAACARIAPAADVFLRFNIRQPAGEKFKVQITGSSHEDPWTFPIIKAEPPGGAWSAWIDLSKWKWHDRFDRAGGLAEWQSILLTVAPATGDEPIKGCAFDVQLADRANDSAVVHNFTEKSASNTIGFLCPVPLREHAKEFETGSQMIARQLAWAKEATAGKPPKLKDFTFITALYGPYDPALGEQTLETLELLGFRIIGNTDVKPLSRHGMRSYQTTWLANPDPREMDKTWKAFADRYLKTAQPSEEHELRYTRATHWVVGDEVQTMPFTSVDQSTLDGWFHDYLRSKNVRDTDLPTPIEQVHYPAKAMFEKTLPRDADLPTRRLMYHAAKFGQWWSARQFRHLSDLIRADLPGAQTETLPSDHGFFNAWGPPYIGMSYRMLDLFELGAQRSVDQLSAEDWLGLNHMYGPSYTWTGAQSHEYFTAICRSAIQSMPRAQPPMLLRNLITMSDDAYLRLKTYSALGQGTKSFFFWTFGPSYLSTENYWSDLRSMYDGIAKLGRALEKAEPVLYPAKPVRDPVAILYSVSHDLWHSDDPAAFVEKRLTWHALRHLHVQPDFIREEDIESGKLKDYKALYIADQCVTRAASEKIDQWVKSGGVVYLAGGAATRDEFYEPYVPAFASDVWPADAAKQFKQESHEYNERKDLPTMKPMTTATVRLPNASAFTLPVLGCRQPMNAQIVDPIARFADNNAPAGAIVARGSGKVIALGFLPMLAYAQGANFKPSTLEEKWPAAPRELTKLALDAARIQPVARCDVPVVETNLLTGDKGSAVVLVNYTYRPLDSVSIDLTIPQAITRDTRVTSTEGSDVKFEPIPGGVRLHLPLKWTDIILIQ
jgi:hypothetical protein